MVSSQLGLARLKGFWDRLGGGQRLVVGAVTLVGLSVIVAFATLPANADAGRSTNVLQPAAKGAAAMPAFGENAEAAWQLDEAWRAQSAADRDAGGGASAFMSLQRALSAERTLLAQASLDQLWPGRTSVSVMVELDPAWEIRSERLLPADPLVRSEKVSKETSNDAGAMIAASGGARRSETQDREFVTDVGERRSGRLAPAIKRLTVAVLYDRSLERSLGFRREDLVQTVKAIVGWDPQRDRPESFSTLVGEFAPVESAWLNGLAVADLARAWGPTAGLVLGAVAVVLLLRVMWRRGARPQRSGALQGVEQESLSPDEQQARLRGEIERTISNDPAALAKLVESWLMEQKV